MAKGHHCEPAASIITKFGGVTKVAEAAEVDISRVTRWRLPKASGGTGGVIPHWNIPKLMTYAAENEIQVSAADFMPVIEAAE